MKQFNGMRHFRPRVRVITEASTFAVKGEERVHSSTRGLFNAFPAGEGEYVPTNPIS